MSRQLTATKTTHEKRGGEGTGGGKGTGDRRRKGGKRERNSKSQAFLICHCLHPVQETNPTTFLDSHKRSPRLKAKFYTREKFVLRIKNSIASSEIGNLYKSLTSQVMNEMAWHMYTSVNCISRVSVSSVWLAVENSPQEQQSESMSSKTILISRSVFRCGREKSVHGRPSWKLAITAIAITLDSGLRLLLL